MVWPYDDDPYDSVPDAPVAPAAPQGNLVAPKDEPGFWQTVGNYLSKATGSATPGQTPAQPAKDADPGTLNRALSNPWVSIPYAVAMGLASSSPRFGGLAHGLNAGVRMGLDAENQNYKREKEQRLSDVLSQAYNAKESVPVIKTGANPLGQVPEPNFPTEGIKSPYESGYSVGGNVDLSSLKMPQEPLTRKYVGTEERPVFSPAAQAYLKAVSDAGYPAEAMRVIGSKIIKEPDKPIAVGRGGSLVGPNGQLLYHNTDATAPKPAKWYDGMQSDTKELVFSELLKKGSNPENIDIADPEQKKVVIGAIDAKAKNKEEANDLKREISQLRMKATEQGLSNQAERLGNEATRIALERERLTNTETERTLRHQLPAKGRGGAILDAATGKIMTPSEAEYQKDPGKFVALTGPQDKAREGFNVLDTHLNATADALDVLRKSGNKLTDNVYALISKFDNDPKMVNLLETLHPLTAYASARGIGGSGSGGRGKWFVDAMGQAGVSAGDNLQTATQKLSTWAKINHQNASKELPGNVADVLYKPTLDRMTEAREMANPPKPEKGKKKTAEERGKELKKSGLQEDAIYRILSNEGYGR